MDLVYVPIEKLHQHEEIDKEHLKVIKNKIQEAGYFKEPIIVDKKYFVVLDGHHRLNSCKELGLTKIPCLLVDYLDNKDIRVTARRKEYNITKQRVVEMGLSNKVFPNKTTKHYVSHRVKNLKILIKELL